LSRHGFNWPLVGRNFKNRRRRRASVCDKENEVMSFLQPASAFVVRLGFLLPSRSFFDQPELAAEWKRVAQTPR